MTDIAITWDTRNFRGDWSITRGDLAVDAGLRSAVLVSLFTDRIASPDYTPPAGGPTDRRGWWGDTYSSAPWGSRLWQLNRSKKSDGRLVLNQARDYCREALQWLLDRGIAAKVAVACDWIKPDVLGIEIEITKPNGTTTRPFRFEWAWTGA